MKRPWIEAGKNLLIVVLMLLAVLQTLYIISPGFLAQLPGIRLLYERRNPQSGVLALQVQDSDLQEAVRPTALSVNTENGRSSWQYSFQATDTAYESLGRWLGEALGTAGTPESMTDQAWTQALGCVGVFYRFPGQVPISALAQWLGGSWSQSSQGLTARDFLVCIQDQAVYLCCWDGSAYYGYPTQISPTALRQALEEYGGDGSLFAFEGAETYPRLAQIDPTTLLTLSNLTVSGAQVQTSFSQEELAVALGFNPYADTGYTAADGSRSFSDSGSRLQIQGSQVTYEGTGLVRARDSSDGALTEAARGLLEELTGSLLGDARLALTDIDRAESTTTLTFSYLVEGIPVTLSQGQAAVVTFTGTELTRLELAVRSFSLTGETSLVMSALQASSLLSPGQGLELVYAEGTGGSLECGWQAVSPASPVPTEAEGR